MSYKKGWTNHDQIDWDKVDTSAPVPLEPGIYWGTVSEAEPRQTQGQPPKPSIRVVLEVTERYPAGESDEEARPRKIFDNFTMTQEGAFKAKNFAEATGIDLPASNAFDDIEEFAGEMVGVEVWVQIGKRRYEGRDRNQVQFYLDDDEETLETANAQFDSSNESGRRPKKAGSRKKRRSAAAAAEDEEEQDDEEEEEEKPARSAKAKKKSKKKAKKTSKKKASRRRAAEEEQEEEDEEEGTDDLNEDEGEEEEEQPQEQQPRRARRRRRAQAEQG